MPTRPSAGWWSSTPAPSSCWRSTTRSGSAASASTGMPVVGSSSSSRPGCATSDGEDPQLTAARELREEAEVQAEHWRLLLTPLPESPGLTDELHHLYLATGLSRADRGDFELRAEEAEMEQLWVPVDELLEAVLDGRVREGPLAAAVLAYDALTRSGDCDHPGPDGRPHRRPAARPPCPRRAQRPAVGGAGEGRLRLRPARAERHRSLPGRSGPTPTCRGCAPGEWGPSSGRCSCRPRSPAMPR